MTDINPSRIWEGFSWKTPALIVPSGGSRRTRVIPGNETKAADGSGNPPLPQTDWMRKQARTAPRDPSFPAEKDADAETATAVRLPSADRDYPVINNAGEKRKPANGPEQSVKEKRRTAIPESFHRFFLRFFIVMKVDLCYHKGT
ncbi:hypothetical protein Cdeb_01811 [Caldibacillus debilis GB1]|uniref:Uncharacterized protein n=1 Tax=Caldibacillus debilis GB1 TaxID=1339248 RepID=A0A420VC56_9BACI|nr:hypothetical protein Cdeb_01811 [Caldibacillus debilis GB1]